MSEVSGDTIKRSITVSGLLRLAGEITFDPRRPVKKQHVSDRPGKGPVTVSYLGLQNSHMESHKSRAAAHACDVPSLSRLLSAKRFKLLNLLKN